MQIHKVQINFKDSPSILETIRRLNEDNIDEDDIMSITKLPLTESRSKKLSRLYITKDGLVTGVDRYSVMNGNKLVCHIQFDSYSQGMIEAVSIIEKITEMEYTDINKIKEIISSYKNYNVRIKKKNKILLVSLSGIDISIETELTDNVTAIKTIKILDNTKKHRLYKFIMEDTAYSLYLPPIDLCNYLESLNEINYNSFKIELIK